MTCAGEKLINLLNRVKIKMFSWKLKIVIKIDNGFDSTRLFRHTHFVSLVDVPAQLHNPSL